MKKRASDCALGYGAEGFLPTRMSRWNLGSMARINGVTPPKTNMEPQNEGLEDAFPFQMGDFQVPC